MKKSIFVDRHVHPSPHPPPHLYYHHRLLQSSIALYYKSSIVNILKFPSVFHFFDLDTFFFTYFNIQDEYSMRGFGGRGKMKMKANKVNKFSKERSSPKKKGVALNRSANLIKLIHYQPTPGNNFKQKHNNKPNPQVQLEARSLRLNNNKIK